MATNATEAMTLKVMLGGTLTTVGEIVKASGPELSCDMVRTDPVGAGYVTKRASLKKDAGKVDYTVMYDKADATHQLFTTAFNSSSNVTIAPCDAAGTALFTCIGPVTKFKAGEFSNDAKQYEAEIAVDVSGQPTIA